MTLQEIIDRALSIAAAGMDPSVAQAFTSEIIAEDLLTQVFGAVGEEAAREERLRHTLRRTKTLAVAGGTITLPSDVLSVYIEDSTLLDPTDTTKRYSYLAWEHFIREALDSRLGHYSVQGEAVLRVVEPGDAYDPSTGPTVSLQLTIPCSPVVPALASSTVAVIDEVAEMIVDRLAQALRPIVRTARR